MPISEFDMLLLALFILAWTVIILIATADMRKKRRIREKIYAGKFMYYKTFEKNWIISSGKNKSKKQKGLKYEDGPGCYVITIYKRPVAHFNYKNYENIYIGQSVNVYKRVHNHFNGKGNGDVYADIKYGKHVYVRFVRCKKADLNKKEIELISAFNATQSYNKTRGGAAKQ